MSLILQLNHGASSGAVTIITDGYSVTRGKTVPVYSGVRFGSDGNMYKLIASGQWQNKGAWLLNGVNTDYYLFRTINSGVLDNDDGTDNQMNANLDFWIFTSDTYTATITFTISSTTGTITEATDPGQIVLSATYDPA